MSSPPYPQGWRLFLVASDGRTPIKARGWFEHGVHDATADPEEWARRVAAFPAANVALACGPESGVIALDVDDKGAVDGFGSLARLEARHGALPPTWRSRTPRDGAHLLFGYPADAHPRNRVGLREWRSDGTRADYPGLDVRGRGASICLPPSRKATGVYRWEAEPGSVPLAPLPRWLLALMLAEPPAQPAPKPVRFRSVDRAARYAAAAVDRECSNLARMGPHTGRNLRLFQAAANLAELVASGLLPQDVAQSALERAAAESGLVREDGWGAVRGTIASGFRRGMANPRVLEACT